MYACICYAVTEDEVRSCVVHGDATSAEDVGVLTGAGTGCGTCLHRLDDLVEEARQAACPVRVLAQASAG